MRKTLIVVFRGKLGFHGIRELSHLETKVLVLHHCMTLGNCAPYAEQYRYTKFGTNLSSQIIVILTQSCPKLP
jgi:hypothetical protein